MLGRFSSCVLMNREGVEVHTNAKPGQCSATLTEQAGSLKYLRYGLRDLAEKSSRQYRPIMPPWVYNQNAVFALSCLLRKPATREKTLMDTCAHCVPTMFRQKKKHPYPGSPRLLVREKSDTIVAVRNSV